MRAMIEVESMLDKVVVAGWDVAVHADGRRAGIRLRRGQEIIESEGRTVTDALLRLIKGQQLLEEGIKRGC